MSSGKQPTESKYSRILSLYTRLMNGEVINKADEADKFGRSVRSIQYDIDDLRAYFSEQKIANGLDKELVYDPKLNGYYLKDSNADAFTNAELLAVSKILLESRSLCLDDMTCILNKLISNCVSKGNERRMRDMLSNELYHYIEPQHHKHFVESLWTISEAVAEQRIMTISYEKSDGSIVERTIQPVGIMFSEYYFYLTAFICDIDKKTVFDNPDDIFPTIYRIDRIRSFEVTQEHFYVPYRDRFEEGEFRKRVQFMTGGRLKYIKFLFKGKNIEPVLDKLPTAKIVEHNDAGYVVTAEVFGDGVDMWIRGQGDLIELLK